MKLLGTILRRNVSPRLLFSAGGGVTPPAPTSADGGASGGLSTTSFDTPAPAAAPAAPVPPPAAVVGAANEKICTVPWKCEVHSLVKVSRKERRENKTNIREVSNIN